MLRGVLVSIVTVASVLASTARAQEVRILSDRPIGPSSEALETAELEACIRENVVRVEASMDSLEDGTVFLTARLCAPIVADAIRAQQRRQREEQVARFQAECDEDGTPGFWGSLFGGYDPCALAEGFAASPNEYNYPLGDIALQVPVEMTGLAAELLLEARLARQTGTE